MNIKLESYLPVQSIDVIAQMKFDTGKHPYKKLLENKKDANDIALYLKDKFDDNSIDNIIETLKDLGIIGQSGEIVEKELVEKEYGKYNILFVKHELCNYYILHFNRIKPSNKSEDISEDGKDYEGVFKDKSWTSLILNNNEKFKIEKIENFIANKLSFEKISEILEITFEDDKMTSQWYFQGELEKKKINKVIKRVEIDKAIFGDLFENWDSEFNRLKYEFKDENNPKEFSKNINKQDINTSDCGNFDKGELTNVPLMPFDENNAIKWLISLLKANLDKDYYSESDLSDKWRELKEENEAFNKYDCDFNYEKILKSVEQYSKDYWKIKALNDLNPFEIGINKKVVHFEKENNINLFDKLKQNIALNSSDTIDIIDRFGNKNPYILKELENYFDINIVDNANEHDRYWIINKKECWQVGGSLNTFLEVFNGKCNIKQNTTFSKFDEYESDKIIKRLGIK